MGKVKRRESKLRVVSECCRVKWQRSATSSGTTTAAASVLAIAA